METKKPQTQAERRKKALQLSKRLSEHYRETNRILEAVLPDLPQPNPEKVKP